MSKTITKVTPPPTIPPINQKLRVVAYARVSTDKEEQLNSLEAQKDYFIQYIGLHEDWEFVGIYFDEGISGLKLDKRE
ncbi:putative DNA recombinase [Streptococcus oralis]|uniref:Putative DNA recombinase n=1 Tax=Streptococcus oralis TaxID=1303 RepID=A0A139RK01_STROR|nr:putative DNA recombinase [Streptococcus oralis]